MTSYQDRAKRLSEQLRASGGTSGIQKRTSNLFRSRGEDGRALDVSDFHHVLEVNAENHWVDVEGMTTYEELVRETLKHGELPAVVPQLKSITIGGAVSGVGIEASSFKYGLVHETILEMDVLLADGSIVTATPTNDHRDLFYGIANSYGTLGYILRVRAKTVPAKAYVHLTYKKFDQPDRFFSAMEQACGSDADFVDGVVFGARDMVLVTSRFTDEAPYTHDYTFMKIFYKSIRKRSEDYLTVSDFMWRWDTDWFWCSKNLYMQNPLVRLLMGRKRLNSITYGSLMRWNNRTKFTERLVEPLRSGGSEAVIQDICIPLAHARTFLSFLLEQIGILPIWICPTKSPSTAKFPLFPIGSGLELDFGFWDIKRTQQTYERGHFNRMIERKTIELNGLKSLYSESFFDRETFWNIYNKHAYDTLKKKYDPDEKRKDLYEKCVTKL